MRKKVLQPKRQNDALRWLALLVIAMNFNLFAGGVSVCAQGDVEIVEDLFSQRNYPWYDSATDGLRKVEFPDRQPADSRNRNDVPLMKPRPKTTAATTTGGMGMSYLAWAGVAIMVAVLVGLLIWAFFRLESDSITTGEAAATRSLADSIEHLPFQVDEKTGDFLQQAENAYRSGDFRRAMTYLFSHVLVTLDQQGLIRLKKGKTNRMYLNELKSYGSLAGFYQQVMVPFEATFFGDHDLSKTEFESCWNNLDGFLAGVNQTSQVAT